MSHTVEGFLMEGVPFSYREDCSDIDAVRETLAYRNLEVTKGDIVLDLGAHIGLASMRFLEAGADLVVAVEPDPGNVEVLRRNLERYGSRAQIIEGVVMDRKGVADFYPSASGHRTRGTTTPTRGREKIEVNAVAMSALLGAYRPNKIKCDIEGGEFSVLTGRLEGVERITAEIHLMRDEWRAAFPAFLENLRARGFTPDRNVDQYLEVTHGWPFTATWSR